MKITNTHIYFYSGREIYSNWHICQFIDPRANSFKFNNSEQCFMYWKAVFFGDKEIANQMLYANNPAESKILGRSIKNYDDDQWNCVRFGFMVYANYLKFSQNEELKNQLLDTQNKILVEASIPDKIWGVGLDEDDPLILDDKNWRGQNLLGKALMEVRNILE